MGEREVLAESHQGQDAMGRGPHAWGCCGWVCWAGNGTNSQEQICFSFMNTSPSGITCRCHSCALFSLLFFSSWFPEWRSHCQWRCLSGESSAPCPSPVVLRGIGLVWGQHSAALHPGLTGVCYPATEQLWCSWKGLGLMGGESWQLHCHASLKRRLVPPARTCPKSVCRWPVP